MLFRSGRLELAVHNLRDWTHDRYRKVDDEPYGGGPGMVLKPEPIFEAIEELTEATTQVVMLCPQGEPFRQAKARELAGHEHLLLLCGSYEGSRREVRSKRRACAYFFSSSFLRSFFI